MARWNRVATPEELVLNPATEYVAEFTRHVSRAKVIQAASVMEPLSGDTHAGDVAHDSVIDEIADQVEGAEAPHRVMKDGEPVGQITRKAAIDVLVGRR